MITSTVMNYEQKLDGAFSGPKTKQNKLFVSGPLLKKNGVGKLHFTSTLVVMSHESNTFFMSVSFVFS